MTLSLRQRILLTLAPTLVLIAGLGVGGVVLLVRLGQRSDAILRENYDSIRAMTRLDDEVEGIDGAFRLALAGQEGEAVAAYRRHWAGYREQLAIEEGNVTIRPDEPLLVADLRERTDAYAARGKAFFDRPVGDAARRLDYLGHDGEAGLQARFLAIERVAAAIRDLNEAEMHSASRQAQATASRSVVYFLAGLGVATLLAVAAVWWLHRAILGPIRAVTEAAQAIGGGQLHLVVPVYGDDEFGRLAGAFNAMTAKLRAYRQSDTERLVRARRTGQATIDSFPDPVVVVDPLGRVESANPAAQRLLGVRSPADDEPRVAWLPPEPLRRAVADALERRIPVLTETFDQALTFREGGEDRDYLPQVRPIRSADGSLPEETLGAAVVLNDVTRFRLLDRLKSDWVATVSHELKTPLTSVRLAVHVLLDEAVGPLGPKQLELLLETRENADRLARLIDQLLALAKLEERREKPKLRRTDPSGLLRAAADRAAARAEDRQIAIALDLADGLPAVAADEDRLGQALNNLLDNALTYTDRGGTVTLAAKLAEDGRVVLTVADTGIGIPAEYLPHVFDRFFRVPGREQPPGTGLGLAIVREVVVAHGGEIACDSAPGRGTTFHITLPTWKGAA